MSDTAAGDYLTTEQARQILVDAEKAKAEAAVDRKAAEKALADARYAEGQAQFHNREASAKVASVQKREEHLRQYVAREAALAEREKTIAAREKVAAETLAAYDRDKHRALQVLMRGEA